MRGLSILIKPSSSLCNIRCKYCFYEDLSEEREIKSYGFMEIETLEIIVKKAFEYVKNGVCNFVFQGGEPTLIGLEFYKELIKFQKKYNIEKATINNSIQTNGMLLDEKWASFFKENNFLVGLSLDGNEIVHNKRRIDPNGIGTFERVLKSKKILDEYNVEYNVLSVLDNELGKNIEAVYEFFKKEDIRFQQYIPCLDSINDKKIICKNLDNDIYLQSMKKLFDLWYADIMKNNIFSIRYFENILMIILTGRAESCDMMGHCSIQNVIESDGGIYPCDFYVSDQWKLGNIKSDNFQDIFNKKLSEDFYRESLNIPEECKECKWYKICRNGCKRYRNLDGKYKYCNEVKEFFEYSIDRFYKLASFIQNKN
ncbi:MAG: anaerobic sulfatase maturase [Cetobacterium sp.]